VEQQFITGCVFYPQMNYDLMKEKLTSEEFENIYELAALPEIL